jgi:Nucleoside-diphosphate-sugar pyrophosphorylase involved in lipopolysaccharide biosynthesis/translation initiation factor 2B, gamma/epsilon subunits (eIF-2Bgamma/eIF-2Bepsilon)
LPIINKKRKIIEILTWNKVFKKTDKIQIDSKISNIPLVIMAGGLGTRLLPYTNILPKPLLPFKGKSMIENVIDQFSIYSIKKILISINFKSEIIKAYFGQILKKNSNLSFIRETKALGTCGPLATIKKKFEDLMVINCDTLVNLNFNEFYNFHKKNNSHITIVTANKDTIIPYGVCDINKSGKVHSFNEKPKINYLANIGLYIINKKLIKQIPKNKKFNMDELISIALKKNIKYLHILF